MPSGSNRRCFRNRSKVCPGRDLDDAAEDVEAGQPAVAPQRARLEVERDGAELRDVGRERVVRAALAEPTPDAR